VGALATAINLRSIDHLSVALLVVWSLSPIGGQSSLRLLQTTNSTVSNGGVVFYADHQAPFFYQGLTGWEAVVPAILSASLMASETLENRTSDLWNHPRIPRIDEIEDTNSSPSPDEMWTDLSNNNTNLTYSSWTGINIQGLRPDRNSDFSVKHSYIYLDCNERLNISSEIELKTLNISFYPGFDYNTSLALGNDIVSKTSICDRAGRDTAGFLLRGYHDNSPVTNQQLYNASDVNELENHSKIYPMSLFYGTVTDESPCANVFECKVNVATVEAQIECAHEDCKVQQIRRFPNTLFRDTSNNICNILFNTLACTLGSTIALDNFVNLFSNVTNVFDRTLKSPQGIGSPFDDYIIGRRTSFGRNPDMSTTRKSAPAEEVAVRLTTLLNTYWQAGSWGTQVVMTEPFNIPPDPDFYNRLNPPKFMTNKTEATFFYHIPVYAASIPWIVILTLTTTVLLALGALNLLLLYSTAAPDIFDHASSLTRENPYIALPPGGTGLDGLERSRLLKDVRVQLVDTKPEDRIGYVALKSVNGREGYSKGRLKLGRSYE
jgi:hypothetical protein